MSAGDDGIPLKLVKLYGGVYPQHFVNVFNDVLFNGIPDARKVARVVPVPKKGNLSVVENYRPGSNLCSISKVLERCFLSQIERAQNYDRLLGVHHHGF